MYDYYTVRKWAHYQGNHQIVRVNIFSWRSCSLWGKIRCESQVHRLILFRCSAFSRLAHFDCNWGFSDCKQRMWIFIRRHSLWAWLGQWMRIQCPNEISHLINKGGGWSDMWSKIKLIDRLKSSIYNFKGSSAKLSERPATSHPIMDSQTAIQTDSLLFAIFMWINIPSLK